ncbi:unnamed protein product, partial [Rotaria magnacalcarata]
ETQYVKNVNGLIKTFIEKNVNSSIERGINEQVRRLENHQVINMDKNSKKKLISLSQTDLKKSIDNIMSKRQIDEDSSINAMSLSRFKLTIIGESRIVNGSIHVNKRYKYVS